MLNMVPKVMLLVLLCISSCVSFQIVYKSYKAIGDDDHEVYQVMLIVQLDYEMDAYVLKHSVYGLSSTPIFRQMKELCFKQLFNINYHVIVKSGYLNKNE